MIARAQAARADSSTASMDLAEQYDASMATVRRAAGPSVLSHPGFFSFDREKACFYGKIIVSFDRATRILAVSMLSIPHDSGMRGAML